MRKTVEDILREVGRLVEATMPPRVLVVEGDPHAAGLAAQHLQYAGYEVSISASGRAAIDRLQFEQPQVALVERTLPDLSGLDVLRTGRSLAPSTEFILLSGDADATSVIEAMDEGAFAYLRKPRDDWQELLARVGAAVYKVRMALENRLLISQLHDAYSRMLRVQVELDMMNEIMGEKVARIERAVRHGLDDLDVTLSSLQRSTSVLAHDAERSVARAGEALHTDPNELIDVAEMVRKGRAQLERLHRQVLAAQAPPATTGPYPVHVA